MSEGIDGILHRSSFRNNVLLWKPVIYFRWWIKMDLKFNLSLYTYKVFFFSSAWRIFLPAEAPVKSLTVFSGLNEPGTDVFGLNWNWENTKGGIRNMLGLKLNWIPARRRNSFNCYKLCSIKTFDIVKLSVNIHPLIQKVFEAHRKISLPLPSVAYGVRLMTRITAKEAFITISKPKVFSFSLHISHE